MRGRDCQRQNREAAGICWLPHRARRTAMVRTIVLSGRAGGPSGRRTGDRKALALAATRSLHVVRRRPITIWFQLSSLNRRKTRREELWQPGRRRPSYGFRGASFSHCRRSIPVLDRAGRGRWLGTDFVTRCIHNCRDRAKLVPRAFGLSCRCLVATPSSSFHFANFDGSRHRRACSPWDCSHCVRHAERSTATAPSTGTCNTPRRSILRRSGRIPIRYAVRLELGRFANLRDEKPWMVQTARGLSSLPR